MNVLPNTISAREAFLHYVSLSYELTEELRAIRLTVLSHERELPRLPR